MFFDKGKNSWLPNMMKNSRVENFQSLIPEFPYCSSIARLTS